MCSRKTAAKISIGLLWILSFAGGITLLVYGITWASTSCNSKYRDCTTEMDQVILVNIGEYKCGYACVRPEYKFAYLNKNGYCFVISDTETFNPDQIYTAYTYHSDGISKCDMNPGRYDADSNIGIILTCVGGVLIITVIIISILIPKKTKLFD